MDDRRFEALLAKSKDGRGLSDEEADELGRALAERAGGRYANADSISPEERESGVVSPEATGRSEPDMVGRLPADQGVPISDAPGG